MTTPALLTYADAYEHCLEWLLLRKLSLPQQPIYEAVREAAVDISNAHDWPHLRRVCRVNLVASQTTGTVVYDHTERQLTLSGTTWPSWIEDAVIRFDSILCTVAHKVSTTVLVLDQYNNPGADVASTTYEALRWRYDLPADFGAIVGGPMAEDVWQMSEGVTLPEMLGYHRVTTSSGTVLRAAIAGRPNRRGEKALFVYPGTNEAATLDFVYDARMRELVYSGYESGDYAGTLAVTADAQAVTGTNTSFESGHAGAFIRVKDASSLPTGRTGNQRYLEQAEIYSVTNGTTLTLATDAVNTWSDYKYRITDPIDIDPAAQKAFLAYCRLNLAEMVGMKSLDLERLKSRCDDALKDAMQGAYPHRSDVMEQQPRVGGVRENYNVSVDEIV